MLLPSITSTSSAQADGQSCGQVEWRISILACWFMPGFVTSIAPFAEGLYSKIPRRKRHDGHALCAEISPAIGVDRLPVDIARRRAAEESHHGGNILGATFLTGDGSVREVMRGFRLVLRARRADQARHDAIDGDAVGSEIMGERAGEAYDSCFRRHHMGAIGCARMRAQPADIDDGPCPALPQRRQAGLYATKGAVERDVHDLPPIGVAHFGERFFAS